MTREPFHPDDPSIWPLVGALIIGGSAVAAIAGWVIFFAWLFWI